MIGFIGLGKMGASMAGNLLAAGFPVMVFARTPKATEALVEKGAQLGSSVAALAASCECVFTIVGGPEDVESLYLGANGLILNASKGTCLVDMTTSSSSLAKLIFNSAAQRGIQVLDAPVTGGVVGANAGTLTFMVGGDASLLEQVKPFFDAMGNHIFHVGDAGAGQMAKSCNQIAVAGITLGMTEALNFARTNELPLEQIYNILGSGTAASALLDTLGRKILTGDNSTSFTVSHFAKDLRIAIESAAQTGSTLPMVECCLKICEGLENSGDGDLGLQFLEEHHHPGHINNVKSGA